MKRIHWGPMMCILIILIPIGCAEITPPASQEIHSRSIPYSFPQQIEDLAGSWKYKDAAGEGIITLNAEGKGVYEWEDGWFETVSMENGMWSGIWIQKGNDREGGFELKFSDDASVAQGRWWYTRIGNDHDPLQSGGTFRMTRSSTLYNSAQ